ncbi:hypothetical protein Gohar_021726 [Gossypium harknessii]|uniref:Uncharacterized protein n=1 Tax=Gossypium harknessii TaxID=34285 RepID=A0A7J9I6Z3_9ROSI|nr:hypothetical protein [Gossypium harknessii]
MLAIKKEIEELKGELMIYKAALSNEMLSSRLKQLEKFKGARSARDVDFFWEMEQYFRAMGIEDDVIKVNTTSIYFIDMVLLWWSCRSIDEKRGITELTVAMVEAVSFVELDPTKDKFGSSKPNGKGNGERNQWKDEEGHIDDGNSINSTSGIENHEIRSGDPTTQGTRRRG